MMSQKELADSTGITQGHLSKIEHGLTVPTGETIERLSDSLGVPVDFFFQKDKTYGLPFTAHPVEPMYRKKSSVRKKSIDFVISMINWQLMHIRKMLNSIDVPVEFELPFLDPQEVKGGASAIASKIRGLWMAPSGPIKHLASYVERSGCIVIMSDWGTVNIDGITLKVPDLPHCIFINDNRPADRIRFTLAHELAHIVMHSTPYPEMEDEANEFASELLMPAMDIYHDLVNVTLKKLANLKNYWRCSMASILQRASDLNCITQRQAKNLWVQMSKYGFRKQEPSEIPDDEEMPTVLGKMIELFFAELDYTKDELSKLFLTYIPDINNFYFEDDFDLQVHKKKLVI